MTTRRDEKQEAKRLVVLGSTGSIGTNTLDIVYRFPEKFRVVGLAAGNNWELLLQQALRLSPKAVSILGEREAALLRERLPSDVRVLSGPDGLIETAVLESDLVVSAVVGAAGLMPTLQAIRAGRNIALANKETLVMAGALVMAEARKRGVVILPVDSEHNAIFQCMMGHARSEVCRILLTASGGPFRNTPAEDMRRLGPEQALAHPTWNMGPKVTIDSSTLMNKGLEAIEAKWFFDLPMDAIDVHIHPQSIVHSMVEYCDGSVVAHLSLPDMRIPIAFAVAYPERLPLDLPKLNLFDVGTLTFEKPDLERFPCLRLAVEAGRAGGTLPAVLNAANEAAVSLFLQSKIGYLDIPVIIQETMERHNSTEETNLEDILEADRWARDTAFGLANVKEF